MDDKLYSIILAAGEGKRMKSKLPKPLQKACGRALIDYVCDAARAAGAEKSIVIIGHGAEQMREYLSWGGEFVRLRVFSSSCKIISQIVIVSFIIGFS